MNESHHSNDKIISTLTSLLNEIGHDLKNKIGVIGTILKDLRSGYPTDEDSLDDSLRLYEHILSLANLLSQNISTQISEDNLKNEHHLNILNYIKSLVIKVIEGTAKLSSDSNTINATMLIQIDKNVVSDNIVIPENFIKNLERTNVFKRPENSQQKILSLQLNLLKSIYRYDSIEFRFKLNDSSETIRLSV